MKNIFILLSALFIQSAYAKLNIVTTTTNLADIVRQVGGEKVTVISLCKGTQDPHYLEAKPSYTYQLSKADLLVSIGAGLEDAWLSLVVRGSRSPKLRIGQDGRLEAYNYVDLLDVRKESVTRADGDVHPEGNPHFLLSPEKAIDVAKALEIRLSKMDADNSKYYKKNYSLFAESLRSIISNGKKKVKNGTKVVTYHKTLSYFLKSFNIEGIDVLEPKPGIAPSASHVLKLIKKIKEEKVKKIIIENYFDDSVARRIQKEAPGVEIKIVPVAVNGAVGINRLQDLYLRLLRDMGE